MAESLGREQRTLKELAVVKDKLIIARSFASDTEDKIAAAVAAEKKKTDAAKTEAGGLRVRLEQMNMEMHKIEERLGMNHIFLPF